jgi:splicing factor 3A subunit 2
VTENFSVMDYSSRPGQKTGSGAPMSDQDMALDRKERLRRLALETIDLKNDPYLMKNHLGTYECKLCLTLHTNEGSYLAHTQAKKHQINLARRAQKEASAGLVVTGPITRKYEAPKYAKIGRPGYKVTKVQDPETMEKGFLFEVSLPNITDGRSAHFRIMSAFEQKMEPPDSESQYFLIGAEPYETICFKIPNRPLNRGPDRTYEHWDQVNKKYTVQIFFQE